MCQTIDNYENQLEAKTLGEGQFGHSGKPGPKRAKQSIIDISEAYMLVNRAIRNHRTGFFKLKPQERKYSLVTVAKTLAKLQNDKNRAHKKLVKALSPKFSQETRALLRWKTPAGGIHALIEQRFKVSNLCQPLQLPFQLLWPPDCRVPCLSQEISKMPSRSQVAVHQSQPLSAQPDAKQPLDRRKSQPQNGVQCQPLDRRKRQPPAAERNQPQNVTRSSRQLPLQPVKSQPPNAGVKPKPSNQSPAASQPQVAAKKQPQKVFQSQVVQNRPQSQPPDAPPQGQPRIVQPPDLPPDPDPSKCKKVRMPIATGNTSYPQWGKATPSYLKIHQLKKK